MRQSIWRYSPCCFFFMHFILKLKVEGHKEKWINNLQNNLGLHIQRSRHKRGFLTYTFFYIKRVIPYPRQPPARGDNKVSVAKVIRTPLAPPLAFDTGQIIVLCVFMSVSCRFFISKSYIQASIEWKNRDTASL